MKKIDNRVFILYTILACSFMFSPILGQVVKDYKGNDHTLRILNSKFHNDPAHDLLTGGGDLDGDTLFLFAVESEHGDGAKGIWDEIHYWHSHTIRAGYPFTRYRYPGAQYFDFEAVPNGLYWDEGFLVWDGLDGDNDEGHNDANSWTSGREPNFEEWTLDGRSDSSGQVIFRADRNGYVHLTDGFRVLHNPYARGHTLGPREISTASIDDGKILITTVNPHLYIDDIKVRLPASGWTEHFFTIKIKDQYSFWLNNTTSTTPSIPNEVGIVELWGGLPDNAYFHAYTGDRFTDCEENVWASADFDFLPAPDGHFEKMNKENYKPLQVTSAPGGGLALGMTSTGTAWDLGGIHSNRHCTTCEDGNGDHYYYLRYARVEFNAKLSSGPYHKPALWSFHNVPDCLPYCLPAPPGNDCADHTPGTETDCGPDNGSGLSGSDEIDFVDCQGGWYNSYWTEENGFADWHYGSVVGCRMTDHGSGYSSNPLPEVRITGDITGIDRTLGTTDDGFLATATATVSGGKIVGINILNGGNYSSTENLRVSIMGGFEDDIHTAVADNGGTQTITTGLTNPPTPKTITATSGGTASDIGAIQVRIIGTNENNDPLDETLPTFTANSATTVVSSNVFKTVTQIVIPAHDGTGATTAIGYTNATATAYLSDNGEDEVYHYNVGVVRKIPYANHSLGLSAFIINFTHIPNNSSTADGDNWLSFSDNYHAFVGEWLPGEVRFLLGTDTDNDGSFDHYKEVGRTTRWVPADYGMGIIANNQAADSPFYAAPSALFVKNINVRPMSANINPLDPCGPTSKKGGSVTNSLSPVSKIIIGNITPNPAKDKVFFEVAFTNESVVDNVPVQIELFNSMGQLVLKPFEDLSGAKSSYSFSTSTLPSGTYYVRVSSGNQKATKSFVIQR